MKIFFILTIFLSSFLLFLIQPMLAKMLLPYVGGAAGVWIVSMLFFQLLLLAGYGYAMLTSRFASPLLQSKLHVLLYAIATLCYLPLALHLAKNIPVSTEPEWWILCTLMLTIALPYFLLAANSSMLQRWYYALFRKEPYYLFSASNAGSFLGLFAYPLWFEWQFDLSGQTHYWSVGFLLLAACLLVFAAYFVITASRHASVNAHQTATFGRLKPSHIGRIVFLSFIPSSLFLSATLYVTTDIASLPLIWVIPLALYLFSFVIVFSPAAERYIKWAQALHPLVLPLFVLSLFLDSATAGLALHFLFFFIIAVSVHGQLARLKPEPHKLTIYYFWMSAGGALGGLCNLLAPYIFSNVYEYYIVVGISIFALPGKHVLLKHIGELRQNKKRLALIVSLCLAVIILNIITSAKPASDGRTTLAQMRNFYGISRIYDYPRKRIFVHGTTVHGIELKSSSEPHPMTTYYQPAFDVITTLTKHNVVKRIGMIGLGIGTTACAVKADQQFDFFEINPDVVSIASNPDYFSYLNDCAPQKRFIMGDGRLKLLEQPGHAYDILLIDAFSSDAIPLHLITREAMQIYADKVKAKTGVILFHITNRHLALAPVCARLAEAIGWNAYVLEVDSKPEKTQFHTIWFATLPPESPWQQTFTKLGYQPLQPAPQTPLWTDAYSNLLSVAHW